MNSDVQDFLDRHKAFWEMEDLGRPLLNFIGYTQMVVPLADGSIPIEDFYLTPDMLTPEKIHPTKEYIQFTYSWPYSIFHTMEGGRRGRKMCFYLFSLISRFRGWRRL